MGREVLIDLSDEDRVEKFAEKRAEGEGVTGPHKRLQGERYRGGSPGYFSSYKNKGENGFSGNPVGFRKRKEKKKKEAKKDLWRKKKGASHAASKGNLDKEEPFLVG